MFKSILPKEFRFFDYFDKHIDHMKNISKELQVLAGGTDDIANTVIRIKTIENELDKITQSCIEALYKTFITPIERTDIFELITKMDDIADFIDSAAKRIVMFEIKSIRPEIQTIADIISKAVNELGDAIHMLRDMKNSDAILSKCLAVHVLENECDVVFHHAIVKLFQEGDAIQIIKWKEVIEKLEKSVDRCEAVAKTIETIIIASA